MSLFLHLSLLKPCFICRPETRKYPKYNKRNIDKNVYDLPQITFEHYGIRLFLKPLDGM